MREKIPSPYECDPRDNLEQCQLYFNISSYQPGKEADQSFVNTTCKCAMDGVHGYCGEVLGTKEYQDSLYALKPVLERSNCHTLDRYDFRSHKDTCGIGFGSSWKDAVE